MSIHSQDNADGFGAEANSWLAGGQDYPSPILRRTQSYLSNAITAATGNPSSNLDRNLLNDLDEIVPLVQSLIDRKANTSFTRGGSVIYTKNPSRELKPHPRSSKILFAAKEYQDEESIAAPRSAKLHLQSFVFKN